MDRLLILQPHGLAPVVRLRVDDPARFLAERWTGFEAALRDDIPRYEGHFVELVDADARPVAQFFGVTRASWGGTWHDHRFSGCARFSFSRPVGYSPPPCPIEE